MDVQRNILRSVWFLILLITLSEISAQPKRWSLSAFGGHTVTSQAVTNPIGLTKDYGGKYWGGVKLGFEFLFRSRTRMGLDAGVSYRDYGFSENASTIPYFTGLAYIHLKQRLFWRFWLNAYGGGEYGKLYESQYVYSNAALNTTEHNLFLHQNDILAVTYGGGLSLSFGRFWMNFGFEKNLQMDTYDQQYGKTIGGRFSNISLQYYLF